MSKRDVEKYFDDVANQYVEMVNTLKDIDEAVQSNLLSPEKLEEIKQRVEPLKNNYMTLSWIMFLLNRPVNKKKHKRYEQTQIKHATKIDSKYKRTPAEVRGENNAILYDLQETLNKLKEDD